MSAISNGSFEEGISLVKKILNNVISKITSNSEFIDEERLSLLNEISFPLPRLKYQDAVDILGLEKGITLSLEQKGELAKDYAPNPFFLTECVIDSLP